MGKFCTNCGKPFETSSTKRRLCDACRKLGQEHRRINNIKRANERRKNLNLKIVYIYHDDLEYMKSIKGDKTIADFVHNLLTDKK